MADLVTATAAEPTDPTAARPPAGPPAQPKPPADAGGQLPPIGAGTIAIRPVAYVRGGVAEPAASGLLALDVTLSGNGREVRTFATLWPAGFDAALRPADVSGDVDAQVAGHVGRLVRRLLGQDAQ